MKFEDNRRAVWARWEKRAGHVFPPDARMAAEDVMGGVNNADDLTALNGFLEDSVKALAALEYFPLPKRGGSAASHARYKRPFEKRLYLVEFVIGRQGMTLGSVRRRSLAPRKRINWVESCDAWNEAHPHDHMTPPVLKAAFYRSVAQEDIKTEFFARYFARLRPLQEGIADQARQIVEQLTAGWGAILDQDTPLREEYADLDLFTDSPKLGTREGGAP